MFAERTAPVGIRTWAMRMLGRIFRPRSAHQVYGEVMDVTLLSFDDYPNWTTTAEYLERLAEERPDLTFGRQLVESPEAADQVGFHGSPALEQLRGALHHG